MKKELEPAEKAKPYAKYFSRPMAPVPREILDFLARGPIDPALALPVQRRNELLNPGYLPAEMGYCLMPDGSGFVAMLTRMPGVTAEMIDWWFAWHGLEGLRYKIWDPDDHYDVRVREEDLPRRLDPGLDPRERNWGTTDIVYEDVGTGPMELFISFLSPEDFGYEMDRFRAPNVLTAVSANLGLNEPKTPLATFTHFAREIPGGIELRSRFWLGWNIVNRQPVRVAGTIPLELARGLAYHCTKEYTNLAAILPKVYEENVNIADKLEDFRK
ncbi:MAG: DAPG hydrolase family protein [Desulfotomaculales bacterium]